MSNEPQTRNPNKVARSGSGAGSTVAIVIAAVAVVLGLLILKKLNDDGGNTVSAPQVTTSTPVDNTSSSVAGGETTTTPAPAPVDVKTGSKVQVANASKQDKVAGRLTTVLAAEGFEMGTAVSASEKYTDSVVLYTAGDTAAQAVAETLARVMGGATVQPLSPPIPITTGKLEDGVGVLVMLGSDRAGKTLTEMQAAPPTSAAATTASTPAASSSTSSSTG